VKIFNLREKIAYLRLQIKVRINVLQHIWKIGELRTLKPHQILLLCADGNRGYSYLGKKYAQYLDSIYERLTDVGLNCLTITTPFSASTGGSCFGNVVTVNGLIARAMIKYGLKRRINSDIESENNPIVLAWCRVLDKVQPKIIIGIQPSLEFCIAAKYKNIWVADLQHGIVLSGQNYYGKAYRQIYSQMGWPDCILCWDEESANRVRLHIGELVQAKVIGNPWVLRFIDPRENDKLVHSARKISLGPEKPLTILVTLQWENDPYGKYHETRIPNALINFIKEQGQEFIWWLRAHPIDMQEPKRHNLFSKLSQTFKKFDNVFWDICSENPLPVILSQTDLHITLQSAVTVEASWFGIKTALLMNNERILFEYFSEQINKGFADIVRPEQEAIRLWIERNKSDVKKNKCQKYMNSDSLDQFINEIKQRVTKSH